MSERFQTILCDMTREVDLKLFEQFVFQELFTRIKECKVSGFSRFNIWRMLFGILPIEGGWEEKKQALDNERKKWSQSYQEVIKGSSKGAPIQQNPKVVKNPLMRMVQKSEKKNEQNDEDLKKCIKMDVERTYQEIHLFQSKEIQQLMQEVLLVWSKKNSEISYMSGMSYLLSSIVLVYFKEAAPGEYSSSNKIEEKYIYLNSVNYAEADVYAVFQKMMEIQNEMFKNEVQKKQGLSINSKNNTPILMRISVLIDQKLKMIDAELFKVFKLKEIKPKTFLLRWIKCIHAMEFDIQNLFFIWDSIFLEAFQSPESKNKKQYEFIDAMCLAMIINMKTLVETRESYNDTMLLFSKYPRLQGQDLFSLISLAWSICEELKSPGKKSSQMEISRQELENRKKLGLGIEDQFRHEDLPKVEAKIEQKIDEKQKGRVFYEQRQIKEVIQCLKKSLFLNRDHDSKELAEKALKILEEEHTKE